MDYYEEFGLPRSASPDQIRRTHKSLVRLLHPDQFQDPELKRLTEAQLKRINEIAAVLSDPDRRREYDSPEGVPAGFLRYREHAGWAVAGVVLLAWLATSLFTSPRRSDRPEPAVAAISEPKRPDLPASTPKTRTRRQSSPVPRPSSAEPASQTGALSQPVSSDGEPPILEPPQLPVPPQFAVAPERTILPDPVPRPKGFIGRWLYPKPPVPPGSGALYPPEYIEAVIALESGKLRGRYRARYLVTDRAISPEVLFRFEGAPERESASLEWVGDGGSRGEVHLRLLSEDSLEVKWIATEMGRNLGLASGTAVLVRRHEP